MSLDHLLYQRFKDLRHQESPELDTSPLWQNTLDGGLDMEPYQCFHLETSTLMGPEAFKGIFKVDLSFVKDTHGSHRFSFDSNGIKSQPVMMRDLQNPFVKRCVSSLKFHLVDCDLGDHKGAGHQDDFEKELLSKNFSHEEVFCVVPKDSRLGNASHVQARFNPSSGWHYHSNYWQDEAINALPLLPLGIYVGPDFDLEKAHQMFGILEAGSKTHVGVKGLPFWQERGLSLAPSGVKTCYVGDSRFDLIPLNWGQKPQDDPLGSRLKKGLIHLEINDISYVSCGYEVLDSKDQLIQVTFKQG